MLESLGYLFAIIFIGVLVTGIASLVKRLLKRLKKTEPMPIKPLKEQIYEYLTEQNCFPTKEQDQIRFVVNKVDFWLMFDDEDTEYFRLYTSFEFRNTDITTLKKLAYKLTKKTKLVKLVVLYNSVVAEVPFYCNSLDYFVNYWGLFLHFIMESISYIINYFNTVEPPKDAPNSKGENAILN